MSGSESAQGLRDDGHRPSRPASIRMMWAQTSDGVIGDGDSMPWHIPEDLAHFRTTTMGAPVIMGRRTWDSLPAKFRPLPGRRNVVLSRSLTPDDIPGAELAHSLDAALDMLGDVPVVWIIGGGRVYREALRIADECEVTEVDGTFEVDTPVRAPELLGWKPVHKGDWSTSSNGPRFRFTTWRPRSEDEY
ncbi:dihydrofolate reductase [Corynebacterium xerosis]|uniref:dihydrofolate reductase n=1 Tax=Corynebacterium xerosis TaxID=1725 RepID=UPI000EB5B42F|nr:dihydrofolate reductase [Corynebacterium xerosis]AYJ33004.1 dihydrofolate reductase [Corynebacterium xerosis]